MCVCVCIMYMDMVRCRYTFSHVDDILAHSDPIRKYTFPFLTFTPRKIQH